jgi:hypothetical protein
MTLVEDAKKAWTWFSVQAMTLAGALQGAWMVIPDDLKASVAPNVVHGVTMALLIAGVAGRLVQQTPKASHAE